jgi:hypothetical protein
VVQRGTLTLHLLNPFSIIPPARKERILLHELWRVVHGRFGVERRIPESITRAASLAVC